MYGRVCFQSLNTQLRGCCGAWPSQSSYPVFWTFICCSRQTFLLWNRAACARTRRKWYQQRYPMPGQALSPHRSEALSEIEIMLPMPLGLTWSQCQSRGWRSCHLVTWPGKHSETQECHTEAADLGKGNSDCLFWLFFSPLLTASFTNGVKFATLTFQYGVRGTKSKKRKQPSVSCFCSEIWWGARFQATGLFLSD